MAQTSGVNDQLKQIAAYAVQTAADKFGQSLDYTENSLDRFEILLQQAHQLYRSQVEGKSVSEEALRRTTRVWGIYLGELVRRKWGGEWVVNGTDIRLVINGKSYAPLQLVYKRITQGPQYDTRKYIAAVTADLAGASKVVQPTPARPVSSPKKPAGNKLVKSVSGFWKSGLAAKIVSVIAVLAILSCCCFGLTQIIPNRGNATTVTTPTLPTTILQAATQITAPTSTTAPAPTASLAFTPSIAPSLTATEIIPSPSPLPPANPLRIHYVDVGQGDAILIQTPNGQTALIDGGDTDTGIIQYLQSTGIQRIDLMIATHPHADHIGGLVQVLQAFPVTKVVTNGQLYTTSVYEHFLDAISSSKAEYAEIKRGDTISLDGIDFHCLNPAGLTNPDLNENSIVLQFTYGQTTFLMTGDSGADTEADLLAANLLSKVDILRVGHHGSAYSSTLAFLNVIKPEVAIYSAGINNNYGHPAPRTIAALVAIGATVYGTDQNGTIIVTADLNGYTLNAAKVNGSITPASIPPGEPTPAFTPTQTTPSAGGLVILSVTSPVNTGNSATLTAKTSPNASCSITVYYKSGPSSASGLSPKNADASGMVSWTWTVGARTTPGTWPIDVTCGGITQSTTFTVK